MIPVMVINNESLVNGLPEIDFVKTYQLRRNYIYPRDLFGSKWTEFDYIAHDDVGLFNWNYLDIILNKPSAYFFNSIHYSTSIGPACVCSDVVGGVYVPGSKVLNNIELLCTAGDRINVLKKQFPLVSLSFENTAYRKHNEAYKHITEPYFISQLIHGNNVGFTLDIAHAIITCRNMHIPIFDYLDYLPLNRCNEIHLSKPIGVDDIHDLPDEEEMVLFDYVLPKVNPSAYVVIEYYKDMKKLKDFYENVLVRYL